MERLFVVVILLLTGCSNPGIVQISPDTYMIYREDYTGIFGSGSSLKAGVISDANAFAEKEGKAVIPISVNYKPVTAGPGGWASFEYQFRVLNKNDPEYRRTSLVPRPDLVTDENIDMNIETEEKKSKNVYLELVELGELRKKFIITEDEFKGQKKKILNRK